MQRNNLRLLLYEKNDILEEASKWLVIFRFASNVNRKLSYKEKEQVEIYSIPDLNVDKIYLKNLQLLKVLSNHISATAIFIPQILNDEYYLNTTERSIEWSSHIKSAAMPKLLAHFNSLMSLVCEPENTRCVFLNSVLEVDWLQDDFMDRGHFSREGGSRFSGEIVTYFLGLSKQP